MPGNTTDFHIQQSAQPSYFKHILVTVAESQIFDTKDLSISLKEKGYTLPTSGIMRSLQLGNKLGLFEKVNRSNYTLTLRGCACKELLRFRPEVYSDVMHFLLFATWELNGHLDHWSWSYAKLCEIMWRDKPQINRNKATFAVLSAEAMKHFPNIDASVGVETVTIVKKWLRQLRPAFLIVEENKVLGSSEREWFSPELALLAVSYLYAARHTIPPSPLLLDSDTVASLSPLCLASPEHIVAMLDIASNTFPMLEIHTGEWGSSVILQKVVDIPMLV